MKKDKHKTTVQFRLERDEPKTVWAFFPNSPEWSEKNLKTIEEGTLIGGKSKDDLRQLFMC